MFLTYVLFSREKESRRAATRDVPPLPPAGDPATTGRFPLFHKLDARLEGVVDRRQARSMPRVPGWMIKVPIVFGVGIGLIFALPNALLRLAMHHPPDGLTWLGLGIGAATFAIVGTAFAVREKRRRAARSQLPLG
jgi:hypothetical protein